MLQLRELLAAIVFQWEKRERFRVKLLVLRPRE